MARYFKKKRYTKFKRTKKYGKRKSAIKKTVKRMLVSRGINRPEVKYFWNAPASGFIPGNVTSTGFQLLPSSMAQSAGESGVIGLDYNAKYIDIRMKFTNTGTNQHMVRMIMVEDLQARANQMYLWGAATNQSDLILRVNSIISPIQQTTRFKLMLDQQFLIGNGGTDPGGPSYLHYKRIFKRLGGVKITHTQGTLSNTTTNKQYYLFLVADGAIINCEINWKIAYTDV